MRLRNSRRPGRAELRRDACCAPTAATGPTRRSPTWSGHVDYLVDRLGIDGVALGSDFDGALIPQAIGSAGGLQHLVTALTAAGYGRDDLAKICRGNWLRVLRLAWHESV